MGDSERAVRKMEPSFRMRNVDFFYFFNVYFTALYEKCYTTGQMKEKMKSCAPSHDHGNCSFTTIVSGKILNQILLEVLMNCTKHFDLSSSLTASCVARFMICWVCRLYFSGLVCSVLSLDECLIKINYGRFCVCFRCLEKVILWSRLCLAKDEFRYHR